MPHMLLCMHARDTYANLAAPGYQHSRDDTFSPWHAIQSEPRLMLLLSRGHVRYATGQAAALSG